MRDGDAFDRVVDPDLTIRFLAMVEVNTAREYGGTHCWTWTGAVQGNGYARFAMWKRVKRFAHRVSYAIFIGAIPEKMHVHHECHNTRCVNPHHLGLLSPSENSVEARLRDGDESTD